MKLRFWNTVLDVLVWSDQRADWLKRQIDWAYKVAYTRREKVSK